MALPVVVMLMAIRIQKVGIQKIKKRDILAGFGG